TPKLNNKMEEIIAVLRSGGVILYPTDTVWGLGCDATNAEAVAKIFAIKHRAEQKAMIVLLPTIDSVARYIDRVPDMAWELFENSRGGKPLTLILPGGAGVADNLLPLERTMAIRVPEHRFCNELLRKLNRPLVSTSANISGQTAAVHLEDVSPEILNAVDYVVDKSNEGQPTGQPSSIISLSLSGEIHIIRP
ncbi:MAG: L-threonylcarbamoyladenylate synthase, partial [Mucinivorans sp.]